MKNMFTSHPRQVCMTYAQHMRLSLRFALMFHVASMKAVVHAFAPCIFITSTSDTVQRADETLKSSGCRDKEEDKI